MPKKGIEKILYDYRKNEELLRYKKQKLQDLYSRPAGDWLIKPTGGPRAMPDVAVADKAELATKLNAEIAELEEKIALVEALKTALDDDLLKVLQMRYIQHKPWQDVAIELAITMRHVMNKRKDLLEIAREFWGDA
ncbi:MAG TPA: hypothetical protein PKX18_10130 [Thermosynergistes sp.]|jgi:hypothetical protein|nr:hypothetical protein [Thermosynergistes sp.]HPZ77316.1 hypothetical protein [Thermosynergistes sp.]